MEDIFKAVGSSEILLDQQEEGYRRFTLTLICVKYLFLNRMPRSSSRNRRSAVKARKSLSAMTPRILDPTNTLEVTNKTIQTIKTHRKKRHGKLRELTREEEDGRHVRATWANGIWDGSEGITCPVCGQDVRGDSDIVEVHVDSCLAHEGRRLEEEQQQQAERWEEEIDDRETRLRATDGANLRGRLTTNG